MGCDVTATIGFGIELEEGCDTPWDKNDLDLESWWIKENSGIDLYKDELTFEQRTQLGKKYPLPFEYSFLGTDAYAQLVLMVPGTVQVAYWSGKIDPYKIFEMYDIEVHNRFEEFMEKYFPDVDFDPSWRLFGSWG